jgi:hypothetical protein
MNAYGTALLLSAAAAIASLGAGAASAWTGITGSGRPMTQQREVSGFNGVALSLPGRLEIVQGPADGVTLTADDNLVPEIETVVEGGVLHVRFRKGLGTTTRTRISVTVKARAIQSIAVAGSGDVVAAALETPELSVRVAGSGDVKLGGRAESLQVRISGSGDVDAGSFDTQRASISVAGSGDATVWARKSLEVRVSGSGDVRYFGDPEVRSKVAGSGSVRRKGASPG